MNIIGLLDSSAFFFQAGFSFSISILITEGKIWGSAFSFEVVVEVLCTCVNTDQRVLGFLGKSRFMYIFVKPAFQLDVETVLVENFT